MRVYFVIVVLLLFNSCTSELRKDPKESLVWQVEFNEQDASIFLERDSLAKPSNIESTIILLNKQFPHIHIFLNKTANDTVFVKIPDADFLTQRSGTSGAESFMAMVTYNLTEINGFVYVNFEFEFGDHAIPGTYSKESFTSF